MTNLILPPIIHPINLDINLHGSKSIANRVLLLASVAKGTSILSNIPEVSLDVTLMLQALKTLGVQITQLSTNKTGASYKIIGCNGVFPVKKCDIFCGNSGTTIRFLVGALSFMNGEYTLYGVPRMHERPIKDLIDTLTQMGADIGYLEKSDYPPILVKKYQHKTSHAAKLCSINGEMSSQYISSVLMALPVLAYHYPQNIPIIKITTPLISVPYINITISLMKLFGVEIAIHDDLITLSNIRSYYKSVDYMVEVDASSASYFFAIGALSGSILVNNLHKTSYQGDVKFVEILKQMGCGVEYLPNGIKVHKADKLLAIDVDMKDMPDVAMTLAVLALFATGTTKISGIQSWQFKETNRLEAMARELAKFDAVVHVTDSSITITPSVKIKNHVSVDTYDDHRIAMSFAIMSTAGVPLVINNPECVNKTFATYFDFYKKLSGVI